jgi:hypothetical protein
MAVPSLSGGWWRNGRSKVMALNTGYLLEDKGGVHTDGKKNRSKNRA